jgi:hypothetical protein
LHSRKLSRTNRGWQCNDRPLYFFHFSGYVPGANKISSHIPLSVARHSLKNRRDLRELFDEYGAELVKNGHEETHVWPYTYEVFTSGKIIPDQVRRHYRENSHRSLNPFADDELIRLGETVHGEVVRNSDATEQLESILSSRAWSWVSRYGRLKARLTKIRSNNG